MYVPDMFRLDDSETILQVMRANNFALLVTAVDGRVQASHLPLLVDDEAGRPARIHGHMARANPHWQDFAPLAAEGGEAMVVFQGPHGYISPNWYPPGNNVPTWNYLAVHAYGRPEIVDDDAHLSAHLERMVATHEAAFTPPWSLDSQQDKYLAGMRRGIVSFEIPIARLEAKAKLSQNKDVSTRAEVAAALETDGGENAQGVADAMRKLVLSDAPAE